MERLAEKPQAAAPAASAACWSQDSPHGGLCRPCWAASTGTQRFTCLMFCCGLGRHPPRPAEQRSALHGAGGHSSPAWGPTVTTSSMQVGFWWRHSFIHSFSALTARVPGQVWG